MPAHLERLHTLQRITPFSMALLLLAGAALSAYAAISTPLPADLTVAGWIQRLATPWLDTVMKAATIPGDMPIAVGSIVVAAAGFFLARKWQEGVATLGVVPLEGLMQGIKMVIDRPRPPAELVRVLESGSSGSFPSGHAYHAVVFGGLVLILLVTRIRPIALRRAVTLLILVLILLIMASRVYLGAHWPSDVLGSAVLGVPSVALLIYLCQSLKGVKKEGLGANRSQTT